MDARSEGGSVWLFWVENWSVFKEAGFAIIG